MDFFKNGFCNRRGPHNQGCLFRHDEIEGQGKIESAKTETGAEVLVFKAEAMGWNGQRAVEKQGFSDVAQAARDWAKSKLREQEARPATLLAGGVAPVPGKTAAAAAAAAAAASLPAGWKQAKAPDGRTYYFHTETKETTWTRPAAALAAPAAADPPLPAGWKQAKAADGRTYYYYLPEGKRTQWVREQP